MNEELKQGQENKEQAPQNEQPNLDTVQQSKEELAASKGWKPLEQWEGDPSDWVDAREFLLREPLFKDNQSLKRELKEMRKTLEEFKNHHSKVREAEYKRALDTLKQQRKDALSDNDADAIVEIEERIEEVRQGLDNIKQEQVTAPKIPQEFFEWVDSNYWYQVNPEMRKEADTIGLTYAKANPGIDPVDVLKYVEKQIKASDKYKHMFKKTPVNPVTSGSTTTPAPSRKDTSKDVELSEDETRAMKRYVRQGILTEAQYKEQIKLLRDSGK